MSRFRLPETVKIGAATYSISESTTLRSEQECDGKIDFRTLVLTVQAGLPSAAALETYLHEVLHGLANERGVNLSERDCSQLGAGLAAIVTDNDWQIR